MSALALYMGQNNFISSCKKQLAGDYIWIGWEKWRNEKEPAIHKEKKKKKKIKKGVLAL